MAFTEGMLDAGNSAFPVNPFFSITFLDFLSVTTFVFSNIPAWSWATESRLAVIFVPDVCAVLQAIELGVCLAAALRGPVECWALLRAAASNWGVSWGDLRKDMVPPGAGC
jgi:hypothetical protein